MRRKAISPLIGYVLLVGFVVALAAFVFSWMSGFSEDSTSDIKERVFDAELCDSMGVSVIACINSSTSQNLYINVTNRGDLRTTKLIFRFIQLRNTSIQDLLVSEINTTIKPQNTKNFSAEQLTLSWEVNDQTQVEVVPATEKEDFLIVCDERKGEAVFENC